MKILLLIFFLLILGLIFLRGNKKQADVQNSIQQDSLDIKDYQWKNRLILLFSASGKGQVYQKQVNTFENKAEELKDRNLLIFHFFDEEVNDTSKPYIFSSNISQTYRQHFKLKEGKFYILLIGKDGGTKYKSKNLTLPSEIFGLIDQMPMRQAEMKK